MLSCALKPHVIHYHPFPPYITRSASSLWCEHSGPLAVLDRLGDQIPQQDPQKDWPDNLHYQRGTGRHHGCQGSSCESLFLLSSPSLIIRFIFKSSLLFASSYYIFKPSKAHPFCPSAFLLIKLQYSLIFEFLFELFDISTI